MLKTILSIKRSSGRITVPTFLGLLLLPISAGDTEVNAGLAPAPLRWEQLKAVAAQAVERLPVVSSAWIVAALVIAAAVAIWGRLRVRHLQRDLVSRKGSIAQHSTALMHAEAELEDTRRRYGQILDGLAEPVVVLQLDGRIVIMNRAARAISRQGDPDQEFHCYQLLHGLEQRCYSGNGCCICGLEIFRKGGDESLTIEHAQLLPDGEVTWYEVMVRPLDWEHGARHLLVSLHDITKRKRTELATRQLADFDPLTGLPNRRLFNDRFKLALATAHRRKEKLALLFLDLDRFKVINDTLGHGVGDLLLQEVAKRLKECCRREEDTIARQGGDEFIIILTEVRDATAAAKIAGEFVNALRERFDLAGQELFVSCSIGISIYPDHGKNSQQLLENADAALYCAKDHGKNCYRVYNSSAK